MLFVCGGWGLERVEGIGAEAQGRCQHQPFAAGFGQLHQRPGQDGWARWVLFVWGRGWVTKRAEGIGT